jgi:hypothetical protein
MAASEGPLMQMARNLQFRNHQFNARTMAAFQMLQFNPAGGIAELEWAEREGEAIEQDRLRLDRAMDDNRALLGATLTPEEAQTRQMMAASWVETRIQIQCGKAQTLLLLSRHAEAQAIVNNALATCPPNASPQARSMLLQLRASLAGFGFGL